MVHDLSYSRVACRVLVWSLPKSIDGSCDCDRAARAERSDSRTPSPFDSIDLELRVAADGVRSVKVIDKRSIPCMSEPTITCSSRMP